MDLQKHKVFIDLATKKNELIADAYAKKNGFRSGTHEQQAEFWGMTNRMFDNCMYDYIRDCEEKGLDPNLDSYIDYLHIWLGGYADAVEWVRDNLYPEGEK